MQTTIPLYGFGGGGGTGATLTVNAPAGTTVTVSKDGKTKTKTAGTDGVAVFKGLATGAWTVSISDGEQTAQKSVTITADYSTAITFFTATIHVTYPAGSTCTATDGVTTLPASDDSGAWDFVVPNAAVWTVTVVENGWFESVAITENNQTETVDLSKFWLYRSGNEYTERTGGLEFSVGRTSGYSIAIGTKGEDTITLECNSYPTAIEAVTANKIDLTNYSTLKCNVIAIKNFVRLLIASAKTHNGDGVSYKDIKSVGVGTLDVSNLTGTYYVCVYMNRASNTANARAEFDSLWLE